MSFIMCNRNELLVSEILKKNQNAFILLYFIAIRAWRGPDMSPRGCGIGEALIGDSSTMGMSPQNYRTAKDHLKKMGFITTKSTSKGTIAKLINTELFDPNFDFGKEQSNERLTSKQRTANGQVTTNNNCKNSNNWNKRPMQTRHEAGRKEEGKRIKVVFPPELDTPEFAEAWDEWETNRREIKKPLTQMAITKQLNKLKKWGSDLAIETINQSIEAGWIGLFPPKVDTNRVVGVTMDEALLEMDTARGWSNGSV